MEIKYCGNTNQKNINNMRYETKLEEAEHVLCWHLYSDKTTDPKHSTMSIEEAEIIIAKERQQSLKKDP